MAKMKTIEMRADADVNEVAKKAFGENARVPSTRWQYRDAPVLGYILVEGSRDAYAVVEVAADA